MFDSTNEPLSNPFSSQSGFGQPFCSQNPFGSQSGGSAFGQPFGSQNTFGSQSGGSAFGGSSTGIFEPTPLSLGSTPAFGASPAPAFGSSMPAFGGSSTGIFEPTPLSLGSTPAFGASQAPAFGSSMPAFGEPYIPAFGMPSSSFGGSSASGQKPAFGGFASFQNQGSPFGSTFQQKQSAFGSNHFGSTQFGASSQPAFSSSSQPAFSSASTPAFGSTTTPDFGATTTPAFGAMATQAFGSTTTSLFGSTGAGFGVSSTPAFGSSATPEFGAPSTSFFGSLSTPAFSVSSTPAFGSSSDPAFGSPTTPSFGFGSSPSSVQSTPKFGSTPFGSTPSPFCTQSSFGVQTTMPSFGSRQSVLGGQAGGSRVVAYAPTPDTDGSSGMQPGGKLESASAMHVYKYKNHEELRWEDYQHGDKGGRNPAGQPANGTSFPAQTQPNRFSSTGTFSQSATNPFSSPPSNPFAPKTTPFGSSASLFSSPFNSSSSSPFGITSTTQVFNAPSNTGFTFSFSISLFAPKTTPFGSSTIGSSSNSLFSSPFNSSSSSPFGTTQVFGAPSDTGFTFSFSTSLFAPKTTPFGSSTIGSSSTSLFNSPFNSSSSSPFGTTSTTQVFGGPSNTGFTFASSPSFFGGTTNVAPSEPLFHSLSFGNTQSSRMFQSSTPSIVQTPSIFGQPATGFQHSTTGFGCPFGTTSTTHLFGAPSNTGFTFASSPSFFGGTTNVASSEPFHSLPFGNTQSSRLFQSSTPSIVQTPSIFGPLATGFQQSTTGFGLNLVGAPATGFRRSQFGSMPSISTTSNPADFDQAIPSIPNAFQIPAPAQTSNAFNFSNFGQTQSAFSGGFGSTSNIFNQGSFLQSRDSTLSDMVPITNPFGTLRAMPKMSIGGAETTPSIDSIKYGISNMRVDDEQTSPIRISSLLAPQYLSQRKSDGQRVSFFTYDEEVPATTNGNALFFPRENPKELFNFVGFTKGRAGKMPENPFARAFHEPLADHCESSTSDGQKESTPSQSEPTQSGAHNDNTQKTGTEDSSCIRISGHQVGEEAIVYEHGAGIEALMPKLRHTDYYTEPRVQELAAKERACPGFCSRVKDFVVGREGFGSIKFYGETDVRRLDLEAIVQFNNQEVVVYKDESEKPALGQGLNKPAEVTLLNVLCVNKKTGQQYIEGARVEKYKEKLAKKAKEHGGELVLYDPVKGEWKFKVKQFID